jgi:hypothetical protein
LLLFKGLTRQSRNPIRKGKTLAEALKGPDNKAQGNALGVPLKQPISDLKGRDNNGPMDSSINPERNDSSNANPGHATHRCPMSPLSRPFRAEAEHL